VAGKNRRRGAKGSRHTITGCRVSAVHAGRGTSNLPVEESRQGTSRESATKLTRHSGNWVPADEPRKLLRRECNDGRGMVSAGSARACRTIPKRQSAPRPACGQSIACSVVEAVFPLLPATVFLLTGYGSALQNSLALPPARSQRLETAFRSPATTVPLREPPRRGQYSWPISSAKF